MGWVPLLTDASAARARDAVRAVGEALGDDAPFEGHAALFWAYAADSIPDGDARYDRALDGLIDRLGSGYARVGLFRGLAGDGWVLAHISEDSHAVLDQIDKQLLDALDELRDFDLISGAAGLALYFAERLEQDHDARGELERVIAKLATRWRADPGIDCGLAHGTPGVIAAASIAVAHGVAAARELLAESLDWLARSRLASGDYPTKLGDRAARTAWCYGDPGIVAALWSTPARREAHDRARSIATRSLDDAHVSDAAFCHGAAGVAHVLHRAYRVTGDEELAAGARLWFERALALPLPTGADLLEGATGFGLALLAAVADQPWGWDRLLACAFPGSEEGA